MRPRTVAIIQGRMAASRLPGKVLIDIADKPMLEHVLVRAKRAHTVDQFVVATTNDPSDDPVENYCQAHSISVFRGDMYDVLDRYYQAACSFNAQIVVRITADCPVIDPDLIDQTVRLLQEDESLDFTCNRLPPPWLRTFPIGLDVEACTFTALECAWRDAKEKHQREHVMPYLYEGLTFAGEILPVARGRSAHGFSIAQLNHAPDHGALRWTVDTPEDLALMRAIFTFFGRDDFSWLDVLALQRSRPEMFTVNSGVEHKTAFDVDKRMKGRDA